MSGHRLNPKAEDHKDESLLQHCLWFLRHPKKIFKGAGEGNGGGGGGGRRGEIGGGGKKRRKAEEGRDGGRETTGKQFFVLTASTQTQNQ